MTYGDFIKVFPTEDDAIDWIISRRFKKGYRCPYCNARLRIYRQNYNRRFLYCNNCKNEFSALNGTIFENTHLDLRMWLYVMMLMKIDRSKAGSKQLTDILNKMFGISEEMAMEAIKQVREDGIYAMRLKKELDISYQSASRMLGKVQSLMEQQTDSSQGSIRGRGRKKVE